MRFSFLIVLLAVIPAHANGVWYKFNVTDAQRINGPTFPQSTQFQFSFQTAPPPSGAQYPSGILTSPLIVTFSGLQAGDKVGVILENHDNQQGSFSSSNISLDWASDDQQWFAQFDKCGGSTVYSFSPESFISDNQFAFYLNSGTSDFTQHVYLEINDTQYEFNFDLYKAVPQP